MEKKLNIIWIVNVVFPEISNFLGIEKSVYGGWIFSYRESLKLLKPNIRLYIVSPYRGKSIEKIEFDNDVFYVFPRDLSHKKLLSFYQKIENDISPDLVHIHGTELPHSMAYVEANGNKHVLVSVQGLVSVYARYYYGGVDSSIYRKNFSIRDFLKCDSLYINRLKFINNGKNEKLLIKSVRNIAGRTSWDYINSLAINKDINYYKLDEPLRKSFYENKWSLNNCQKHSIFLSQTYYPIKGLHKMLEAMPYILERYPDAILYLCGDDCSKFPWYRRSAYWNYIKRLIKNLDLNKNICFLGKLTEEQMVEQYLKSHVFVCPSIIENSSNSVCEAQLLGVPSVVSYVGGLMDLVEDGKTGLLYRFEETAFLAYNICRYFENDELALSVSRKSIEIASDRHDRVKIAKDLIAIYKDIIG